MPSSQVTSSQVTFTPTLEDAIAAYRLYGKRSRRALLLGMLAVCVVGCVVVPLAGLPTYALAWLVPAYLVLFFSLLWLVSRALLPRRVRRLYRQQASLRQETTFAWDAEGLSGSSSRGTVKTPWSDYAKRREDPDTILLYHSDNLFQFIPRRILSPSQQAELAALYAAIPVKP